MSAGVAYRLTALTGILLYVGAALTALGCGAVPAAAPPRHARHGGTTTIRTATPQPTPSPAPEPTPSPSGGTSASGGASSGGGGGAPVRPPHPCRLFAHQLRSANLAFNTPTKLVVGHTAVVDLRLSTQVPTSRLIPEVSGPGSRVGAHTCASAVMEATLTGEAFKIQDITATRQPVSAFVTDWRWQIDPTQPGIQQLNLALNAFITDNRTQTEYAIRTFERTLDIQAVAVPSYTKITNFLAANWAWIAGLLGLLTAAIQAWRRWRRPHRDARPKTPDHTDQPRPRADGTRPKPTSSGRPSGHKRRRARKRG